MFDLDGTLVNTVDAIIKSINQSRLNAGFPLRSSHELFALVGLEPTKFFEDLQISSREIESLVFDFRSELSKINFTEADVYPGVRELLQYLKQNNVRLAIATNKPSPNAEKLLARVGLLDFFETVQGSEPGLHSKPEGDILRKCLAKLEVHNAVMVGDRVEDVLAAKKVSISSIGIGQTYHTIEDFQENGASFAYSSILELVRFLEKGSNLSKLLV